jgi:hypothetical protein
VKPIAAKHGNSGALRQSPFVVALAGNISCMCCMLLRYRPVRPGSQVKHLQDCQQTLPEVGTVICGNTTGNCAATRQFCVDLAGTGGGTADNVSFHEAACVALHVSCRPR